MAAFSTSISIYLYIELGTVVGAPRAVFSAKVYLDEDRLVLDKPSISISIDRSDIRIKRYAYEIRVKVSIARNGSRVIAEKVLDCSTIDVGLWLCKIDHCVY